MDAEDLAREFPLVGDYLGRRIGITLTELPRGRTTIVETPRRLVREESYGYVRALWWAWLADGRSVVSVPPEAAEVVRPLVAAVARPEQLSEPVLAERLRAAIDPVLARAGCPPTDRALRGRQFACNARLLRRHRCGQCRRLLDKSIPPAEGLTLPAHCFPDGVVYGVIADGQVVSVAHAHRTGLMEDVVADLGIPGTAIPYRRRGYGKTAVSAVVAHFARAGGEAFWSASPDNAAAAATAASVGFRPYAVSLALSAPSEGPAGPPG